MEAQLIENYEASCTRLSEIAESLNSHYCELNTRGQFLYVVIDKYNISAYIHFVLGTETDDFFRVSIVDNIDGCETEYDNIHDFSSSDEVIEFIKTYQPNEQSDNYSDDGWFDTRTPDPDDFSTGHVSPDLDDYYETPDSP
jgi:hypothetical protein